MGFISSGRRRGVGEGGRDVPLRPHPPVLVSRGRDLLRDYGQSGWREQPQGSHCGSYFLTTCFKFQVSRFSQLQKPPLSVLSRCPRRTTRSRTPKHTARRRRLSPSTPPLSANNHSRTCTSQCSSHQPNTHFTNNYLTTLLPLPCARFVGRINIYTDSESVAR